MGRKTQVGTVQPSGRYAYWLSRSRLFSFLPLSDFPVGVAASRGAEIPDLFAITPVQLDGGVCSKLPGRLKAQPIESRKPAFQTSHKSAASRNESSGSRLGTNSCATYPLNPESAIPFITPSH